MKNYLKIRAENLRRSVEHLEEELERQSRCLDEGRDMSVHAVESLRELQTMLYKREEELMEVEGEIERQNKQSRTRLV